jgi:hypothetical protein
MSDYHYRLLYRVLACTLYWTLRAALDDLNEKDLRANLFRRARTRSVMNKRAVSCQFVDLLTKTNYTINFCRINLIFYWKTSNGPVPLGSRYESTTTKY